MCACGRHGVIRAVYVPHSDGGLTVTQQSNTGNCTAFKNLWICSRQLPVTFLTSMRPAVGSTALSVSQGWAHLSPVVVYFTAALVGGIIGSPSETLQWVSKHLLNSGSLGWALGSLFHAHQPLVKNLSLLPSLPAPAELHVTREQSSALGHQSERTKACATALP